MLPAYIIEKLRERDAQKQSWGHQPQLELPLPISSPAGHRQLPADDTARGVVVIPIWDGDSI